MYILIAVLLTVAVSSAEHVESKITCGGETMRLKCKDDEVLKISSANYGRTNSTQCWQDKNVNCLEPDSLDIVKYKCEGKRKCKVIANDNIFGDPCACTLKYLDVKYSCVPGNITSPPPCPPVQFRCDNGICMSKSFLCNGYPECPGGDDENGCGYRTVHTCEGQTMNLKCGSDEVIRFVSGNYGRTRSPLCGENCNIYCHSAIAHSILKDKCDFKNNCSVESNNKIFANPCNDVKKYIEMNYYCSKYEA